VPAESVTEVPVESVTEVPTESVTEVPTEPVTEVPAEPVTEVPAEPVVETTIWGHCSIEIVAPAEESFGGEEIPTTRPAVPEVFATETISEVAIS